MKKIKTISNISLGASSHVLHTKPVEQRSVSHVYFTGSKLSSHSSHASDMSAKTCLKGKFNIYEYLVQKPQDKAQTSTKRLKSSKIDHIYKRLENYQKLKSSKKGHNLGDKSLRSDSSRCMSQSDLSKYEIAHSNSNDHQSLSHHANADFYVHSEYVMKVRPKT